MKEFFLLKDVMDNPMFEGFGVADFNEPSLIGRKNRLEDLVPGYEAPDNDKFYQPTRLDKVWKPLKVVGRVTPFNDYPCLLWHPVFTQRACMILGEYLIQNGELLPLDSELGKYYLLNITTIVDALNLEKSKCEFWCEPPTTAIRIDRYEFDPARLPDAAIFRIFEKPEDIIVSSDFVRRVQDNGLNGFVFKKIWPLPEGVNWEDYNEQNLAVTNNQQLNVKNHTLVIMLGLKDKTAKVTEQRKIEKIENELDSMLTVKSMSDVYYGSYEGSDTLDKEYRMFLSCPNVDQLYKKLEVWLSHLPWAGGVRVVKRYGGMYDENSEQVEC